MRRDTKLHIMFADDGTLCDWDGDHVDSMNATDSMEDATCLNCLKIMHRTAERNVRWYTRIVSNGVVPPFLRDKGITLGKCIQRLHDRKERLEAIEKRIAEVNRD